ncbi:hypothetical protein BA190_17185 [Labrys sp. WJW]|nr:hypothetical protein BA190_17185 [Labrys sp. WJW]
MIRHHILHWQIVAKLANVNDARPRAIGAGEGGRSEVEFVKTSAQQLSMSLRAIDRQQGSLCDLPAAIMAFQLPAVHHGPMDPISHRHAMVGESFWLAIVIEVNDLKVGRHHSAIASQVDQRQAGKMGEAAGNRLAMLGALDKCGDVPGALCTIQCRATVKNAILCVDRQGVIGMSSVGTWRVRGYELVDRKFVLDGAQAALETVLVR